MHKKHTHIDLSGVIACNLIASLRNKKSSVISLHMFISFYILALDCYQQQAVKKRNEPPTEFI